MQHLSDHDLIRRSVSGDRLSWSAYVQRRHDWVRCFHAELVRHPHTAADLASETFAAASLASSRYRPSGPTSHVWLLSLADAVYRTSCREGRVASRLRRLVGADVVCLYTEALRGVDGLERVAPQPLDEAPPEAPALRARLIERAPRSELLLPSGLTVEVEP